MVPKNFSDILLKFAINFNTSCHFFSVSQASKAIKHSIWFDDG